MTEAATYHGMKSLADCVGYRLLGLPMDDEGLIPDQLDRACAAGTSRVLFTMPTLQNPTARTMSLGRRREIVRIAHKYDLLIIEDDVHSFLDGNETPLAVLAPERVFHVSSTAKCMPPGPRVGTLVASENQLFCPPSNQSRSRQYRRHLLE
jgi:DNA-binding transcriptional MocR family regulator